LTALCPLWANNSFARAPTIPSLLPPAPLPPPPPPLGGSSGIGLAIVRKLAAQGLNVVIVAMPDALLASCQAPLRAAYPDVEFRTVGVQLGSGDYLERVAEATADVPVTIVINNAGYMKTGLFEANEWKVHLDNINCNATAAVALAHLYVRRMRAQNLRGCITFTSSPAGFMPSPFSVLYGATKTMLTHFATSLAAELNRDGIDVCVLHPSPVQTNFYAGAHAMPTLQFFQSTGGTADHVADVLLRSVGRCVIVDQGYYSVALRLLLRVIDFAFLSEVVAVSAHQTGDYKVLKAALAAAKAPGGVGAAAAAAPAAAAAVVAAAAAAPAPTPAASKRRNSVARK
jgi:short-subunit dehydrogenase